MFSKPTFQISSTFLEPFNLTWWYFFCEFKLWTFRFSPKKSYTNVISFWLLYLSIVDKRIEPAKKFSDSLGDQLYMVSMLGSNPPHQIPDEKLQLNNKRPHTCVSSAIKVCSNFSHQFFNKTIVLALETRY